MTKRRLAQALALLVAVVALECRAPAAGAAAPPDSKPAGPICAAILEPEVLADLPIAERKALAGMLDMLLTANLVENHDFVLVGRQALDKLLEEKALAAGGLVKVPAGEVAESLRPFWSAGVLICPVVRQVKAGQDTRPGANPALAIEVEAVLAQTGQSLGEASAAAAWRNGGWEKPPALEVPLKTLWADLPRSFQETRASRLIEIADVRLTSSLRRLQWMADDLGDVLRTSLALPGVTLLRPRHPISTREERLLRVMGLAAPTGKDPSAELMCSPDLRLDTELTEEVGKELDYDKTRISATLSLQAREGPPAQKTFSGTVSQYIVLAADASAWLNAQLVPAGSTAGEALDREYSKQVALRELAEARQLVQACGLYSLGYYRTETEQAMRAKVLDHAMRASHLDPTNEEAARLVVLGIDSPYWLRGDGRSRVCYDRVVAEGLRYLDRFGKSPHADEVRWQAGPAAFQQLTEMRHGGSSIELPYNPEIYRYAKFSLLTLEPAIRRGDGDNLWGYAEIVGQDILGHCPADQLEEQRTYWREYWKKTVEPLGGDVPPWGLIEVYYFIRKKDTVALRNLLTDLARRYPRANWVVWRGTGLFEGKPGWKVRLTQWLKLAGDPEWETWEPTFAGETFDWNPNDFGPFLRRFNPPMPGFWSAKDAQPLPADRIALECDRAVRPEDRNKGVCPLLSAGGCMWLCRPPPGKDLTTPRDLLVVPMESLSAPGRELAVKAEVIEWPAHPSDGQKEAPGKAIRCWLATSEAGVPTVWIGTAWHGLARFDLKDGQWRGRWYAAREGVPGEDILMVRPCLHKGKPKLLILSQVPQPPVGAQQGQVFLWVLDPAGGGMTAITSGKWETYWLTFRQAPVCLGLVAAWKDGTRIPLRLYNRDDFPQLDADDIAGLTEGELTFVLARDEVKTHIWGATDGTLTELDEKMSPRKLLDRAPCGDEIFYYSPGAQGHAGIRFATYHNETKSIRPVFYPDAGCLWNMPQAPILDIQCSTSSPATLWGWVGGMFAAYRPAARAPMEENDAWYGPWKTNAFPDSLVPIGDYLWMGGFTGDLYRLNPSEALSAAERQGSARSTAQWMAQYRERMEPSWLNAVRMHISEKQYDKAIAATNAARQSPQTQASPGYLDFWEALARARKGDLAMAGRLYLKLVDDPRLEPFVRGVALVSLVNVRHAAADWPGVDQALDRLISIFPGLNQRDFGMKDTIDWFREEARKGRSAGNSVAAPAAETPEKQK